MRPRRPTRRARAANRAPSDALLLIRPIPGFLAGIAATACVVAAVAIPGDLQAAATSAYDATPAGIAVECTSDRVRIGHKAITGPLILEGFDSRSQAQDAFPTLQNNIVPGEHFSPSTDRFGTAAFSCGTDLGAGSSPNLITGDSIHVQVIDARNTGLITSVKLYAAIVSGPHAGLSPPLYPIGAHGFFAVEADSMRDANGVVIADWWTVDLDDTYFRGGDVLRYFWEARDAWGGFASLPTGLTELPVSVSAAEALTGGLHEVSFLPAIDWDPSYLAALRADGWGDIDPTPQQVANSSQRSCILYYQKLVSRRRSGPLQQTSFMRTLDALGYRGFYDVYDVQGYGNTNNQLGGRASLAQLTGYALIIQDDGPSLLTPNLPDGSSMDTEKIDQASFYRDWLQDGHTSEAGVHALWIIGENTAFEKATHALIASDMGVAAVVDNVRPEWPFLDVYGVRYMPWARGDSTNSATDRFSLEGGCTVSRSYDGYTAGGTAVRTHRYQRVFLPDTTTVVGGGAIVMNRSSTLKWNTILQGFPWSSIRHEFGSAPGRPGPAATLMSKVLFGVLPVSCWRGVNPADGSSDPEPEALPRVTALHPNMPNPFNPTTTIRFDIATAGRVVVAIHDARGRRVRTLVDEPLAPGRYAEPWSGLDDQGRRVASGIYFYRLMAPDLIATRKMVALK